MSRDISILHKDSKVILPKELHEHVVSVPLLEIHLADLLQLLIGLMILSMDSFLPSMAFRAEMDCQSVFICNPPICGPVEDVMLLQVSHLPAQVTFFRILFYD